MSLFGEYLKELIKSHGISISELARKSNVERTMIHKAISDKRIISYNAVDSICSTMRLTPKEERTLKSYYNIIFQGEKKFKIYRIVQDIFYELSNLNNLSEINISSYINLDDLKKITKNNTIFSGEAIVYMILRSVIFIELQQENPRFELTIPPTMSFFNNFFIDIKQNCHKEVDIKHIISFDADNEFNIKSLEYLKYILPLSIIFGQSYKVYYYYENNFSSRFVEPFPYFLVTHNHVICFSDSGDSIMFLTSEFEVKYYHKNLKKYIKNCRELIDYKNQFLDNSYYKNSIYEDSVINVMIQPCIISAFTEKNFINKLICDKENKDYILNFIKLYIENLKKCKHIYTIFNINGLKNFIETGYLNEIPKECISPFDRKEIKYFLELFINEVKCGKILAQIYDKENFEFPEYLSIYIGKSIGLNIIINDKFFNNNRFFSINISENGICKVFYDFFKYLSESGTCLSEEKTVEEIENIVKYI